jgi:hypothetical protein
MTKSVNNVVTHGLNVEIIISKASQQSSKVSKKQAAHRNCSQKMAIYATTALKNPETNEYRDSTGRILSFRFNKKLMTKYFIHILIKLKSSTIRKDFRNCIIKQKFMQTFFCLSSNLFSSRKRIVL